MKSTAILLSWLLVPAVVACTSDESIGADETPDDPSESADSGSSALSEAEDASSAESPEDSGTGDDPIAPTETPAPGPTLADCQLPQCPVAEDPTLADGPAVSFRDDVYPVIQRACNDFACHGNESEAAAELFLGEPPPADVDSASIHALLVGVPSITAPAVDLVSPGSAEESFFMLKIDGCQNAHALDCERQPGSESEAACGGNMPLAGRPVCNADRDRIRRWIAQGALDN